MPYELTYCAALCRHCLFLCEQTKVEIWRAFAAAIMRVERASGSTFLSSCFRKTWLWSWPEFMTKGEDWVSWLSQNCCRSHADLILPHNQENMNFITWGLECLGLPSLWQKNVEITLTDITIVIRVKILVGGVILFSHFQWNKKNKLIKKTWRWYFCCLNQASRLLLSKLCDVDIAKLLWQYLPLYMCRHTSSPGRRMTPNNSAKLLKSNINNLFRRVCVRQLQSGFFSLAAICFCCSPTKYCASIG